MQPCGKWISGACFGTATREYAEGEPRSHTASETRSLCMFIYERHSLTTLPAPDMIELLRENMYFFLRGRNRQGGGWGLPLIT